MWICRWWHEANSLYILLFENQTKLLIAEMCLPAKCLHDLKSSWFHLSESCSSHFAKHQVFPLSPIQNADTWLRIKFLQTFKLDLNLFVAWNVTTFSACFTCSFCLYSTDWSAERWMKQSWARAISVVFGYFFVCSCEEGAEARYDFLSRLQLYRQLDTELPCVGYRDTNPPASLFHLL